MSDTSLTRVVTGTGIIVRYSFYLVGALVIGMVGIGILSAYNSRPVADPLADHHRRTLRPDGTAAVRRRAQSRRQLQHRRGLSAAGALLTADTVPQISSLMPRNMRSVMSSNYHDLETRFGAVRATEFRIESDGQWKQCLAFASRFDTPAMYLIGWFCDASGAKPNAATLACTLDRFTLDRDLPSSEADAFMRTRMSRPASCSAIPVSQTTDTRPRPAISSPQRWSTPSSTYRRN
jgi:hypothetical protein